MCDVTQVGLESRLRGEEMKINRKPKIVQMHGHVFTVPWWLNPDSLDLMSLILGSTKITDQEGRVIKLKSFGNPLESEKGIRNLLEGAQSGQIL